METLERLCAVAREAGTATLRHYGVRSVVELKADRSPLTEADRESHRIIISALQAAWPDVPVVSEEGEIPPYDLRRGWTRFWLVDPLDGTKEFLQQNGEFTVNIALIEHGVPVLGVVNAPALEALYYAGARLGSWKVENGAVPERLAGPPPVPPEGVTVVESRSHPSPELESYLRTIRVAGRVQAGSSLKFGWVAEGRAHCYPRFGPTREWDVAAGDCVFRNAALQGQRPSPLRYNKPDLVNPSFVIGETR